MRFWSRKQKPAPDPAAVLMSLLGPGLYFYEGRSKGRYRFSLSREDSGEITLHTYELMREDVLTPDTGDLEPALDHASTSLRKVMSKLDL